MNQVITLAILALGSATATFAERAASFGPESVNGAPIVLGQVETEATKSQGRVPQAVDTVKQAPAVFGVSNDSEVKGSERVPFAAQGIKQVTPGAEARPNAGFSFSKFVARFRA